MEAKHVRVEVKLDLFRQTIEHSELAKELVHKFVDVPEKIYDGETGLYRPPHARSENEKSEGRNGA